MESEACMSSISDTKNGRESKGCRKKVMNAKTSESDHQTALRRPLQRRQSETESCALFRWAGQDYVDTSVVAHDPFRCEHIFKIGTRIKGDGYCVRQGSADD